MADFEVYIKKNNMEIVREELDERIVAALEAAGAEAEKIAAKKAPVDTGLLRNSITHALADDGSEKAVYIGTNVEYAPYVELGTSHQDPQPYIKPAIVENVDRYRQIIEKILNGD